MAIHAVPIASSRAAAPESFFETGSENPLATGKTGPRPLPRTAADETPVMLSIEALPRPFAASIAVPLVGALALAQSIPPSSVHVQRISSGNCVAKTAIEFLSPMAAEEIPVLHGPPPFQAWHVILELGLEQVAGQLTPVRELHYKPSPGLAAPLPTDVNNDGIKGDPHPGIPGLTLTFSDDLLVNGTLLPAGTNLASLFEMIGSEIQHGGDQTTRLAWCVVPQIFQVIDIDLSLTTLLTATINGRTDQVIAKHGFDPQFFPCTATGGSGQTPTTSFFAPDWVSTVDSNVFPDAMREPFLVGFEVRIPCWFDPSTNPPTPKPLDPLPGPGFAGMIMTGNFPNIAGPGPHPMWPTVYTTFSDTYFDMPTGSLVPGGIVGGGTCATIYGTTGPNLTFAFEQASVDSWYGVNGMPNLAPMLSDDQMIYRFTMIADGRILDSDVTPNEMLIHGTAETQCNLFSITNVRVKHRPNITTPDPGP